MWSQGEIAMKTPNAGHSAIEVRVRDVAQLFNSLDPSPFRERDLDTDAEDFIVSWARELPQHDKLQIVIHLPDDQVRQAEEQRLGVAITNYFEGRAVRSQQDINELLRGGRRHLWVGVTVLTACLVASQMLGNLGLAQPLARIMEESLIIVGWVANWKPIDIFLYAWWPIKRRIKLYRRLSNAEIILQPPK